MDFLLLQWIRGIPLFFFTNFFTPSYFFQTEFIVVYSAILYVSPEISKTDSQISVYGIAACKCIKCITVS